MAHRYFSQRNGSNPNLGGLPLDDVIQLFRRVFERMRKDGYFDEAFGFTCVDLGDVDGAVPDVDLEILLTVKKNNLWPIDQWSQFYSEDDFFDIIEFLNQYVSKPIDGTFHNYNECGMHWETFNKQQGQSEYRERVNGVLGQYSESYELTESGYVLRKPEAGFEQIFEADLPVKDENVRSRIESAVLRYRRHGSTLDDRRQAVRDLADVLEYLRPKVKPLLTTSDEKDIFNLANNFGIRHHNDKQKINYDAALWLSWMFYFYLSTIHVLLRKLGERGRKNLTIRSSGRP